MKTFEQRKIMHQIARSVERVTSVTLEQLRAKIKKQEIADTRNLFYYIANKKYGVAYTAIGEYLDRDHSSCVSGAQRIAALMEVNQNVLDRFQQILIDLQVPTAADEVMEKVHRVEYISEQLEKMREAIQMLTERVEQLEQVAGVEGSKIDWKAIASIC